MPVQEAPIDYHVQRAKLPDNVDESRKCPDARLHKRDLVLERGVDDNHFMKKWE
ncbi:hypothetical protein DAPPUDRAFT_252547 [Daphnia pulex]|uniref:Uncharacterized protein n=1 Tax=Daphnia pulex TaxID=6669 RepID=E9H2Y3_DAPPU|nr:hypothetical protein DAPPUDRAFT_252547 [Daphnia pulex]|eukprot:EFX73867.1 hypothetical protein DAPPUDRAFT_252547 [Daphnia pulex]